MLWLYDFLQLMLGCNGLAPPHPSMFPTWVCSHLQAMPNHASHWKAISPRLFCHLSRGYGLLRMAALLLVHSRTSISAGPHWGGGADLSFPNHPTARETPASGPWTAVQALCLLVPQFSVCSRGTCWASLVYGARGGADRGRALGEASKGQWRGLRPSLPSPISPTSPLY